MVSSFRSLEKATGYQKFFKWGWYDWTGPDTFKLFRGCLLFSVTKEFAEVLGEEDVWATSVVLRSCNSLSFTNSFIKLSKYSDKLITYWQVSAKLDQLKTTRFQVALTGLLLLKLNTCVCACANSSCNSASSFFRVPIDLYSRARGLRTSTTYTHNF